MTKNHPGSINPNSIDPAIHSRDVDQANTDLKDSMKTTPRKRKRSSRSLDLRAKMENHEAGYETNDESGKCFTIK